MLEFFILFTIVGAILRFILEKDLAIGTIIVITIIWAFIYGPWAVATFFELLIGFAIVEKFKE